MARMDKENWCKDLFDSGIEESADYVNSRLTKFIIDEKKKPHNEWVVLDYPSSDVMRSIYQSNDYNVSEFNKIKQKQKDG